MKRAYADIPEGQIHYRYDGSGEPLVLIHQTPASSDEYSLLVPELGKSCRAIAMDTMGYGMSDFPAPHPTIADYARHVKEFLTALGLKKASVFGHHTGATIAVEFAAAYPDMVDKVILSGCPLYTPEVRAARQKMAKEAVLKITADGSYVTDFWGLLAKYNTDAPPEFWHKTLVAGLMPAERREDAHHAVFFYEEQTRLPLIKAPTLVLSGGKDLFIGLLETTRNLIPRARTQVVEGGASLIALTKPKELAAAITEFLKNPGV